MDKLKKTLTRLQEAGLKVHANKSKFCAHEMEYLRYILTRNRIKPQSNEIEAILALNPPTKCQRVKTIPLNGTILQGHVDEKK